MSNKKRHCITGTIYTLWVMISRFSPKWSFSGVDAADDNSTGDSSSGGYQANIPPYVNQGSSKGDLSDGGQQQFPESGRGKRDVVAAAEKGRTSNRATEVNGLSNYSSSDFSDLVGFTVDEVISTAKWYYWNATEERSSIINKDDFVGEYIRRSSLLDKSCFEFNVKDADGNGGGLTMSDTELYYFRIDHKTEKMDLSTNVAGLEVYVNKQPGWRYASRGDLGLRPATRNYLTFTRKEYEFLPLPYKSLTPHGCVDVESPGFVNPVLTRPTYSPEICHWEVINTLCSLYHNCSLKPFDELLGFPECSLAKLSKFLNCLSLRSKQKLSNELCPTPCKYAKYDVEFSALGHKNPAITPYMVLGKPDELDKIGDPTNNTFIEIIISPKEMEVTRMSHVPEMTMLDILSSFGGLMGLFLGASVLTLTEFVEALAVTCLILYSRLRRRLGCNNVRRED